MLMIKDSIADITLQQVLTASQGLLRDRLQMNLNGDYLSDALGRPRSAAHRHREHANINYATGHAIFEATHGTAPKYANFSMTS